MVNRLTMLNFIVSDGVSGHFLVHLIRISKFKNICEISRV